MTAALWRVWSTPSPLGRDYVYLYSEEAAQQYATITGGIIERFAAAPAPDIAALVDVWRNAATLKDGTPCTCLICHGRRLCADELERTTKAR